MEKKTKSKWVIINVTCVATALVCIGLTFWGNFKNGGVVTIDAYLGVIGTLIGICATIMVGLQIWNHLEFREVRDRIKRLDETDEEINDHKAELVLIKKEMKQSIGQLYTANSITTEGSCISYYYHAQSILQDYWSNDNMVLGANSPMRHKVLYGRMSSLYEKFCKLKEPYDPYMGFYCGLFYDDFINFTPPEEYENRNDIIKKQSEIIVKINSILQSINDVPEQKNESSINKCKCCEEQLNSNE